MALSLVAVASLVVAIGAAVASELSVATEARRDYTVHSHDKKVNTRKKNECKISFYDRSWAPLLMGVVGEYQS